MASLDLGKLMVSVEVKGADQAKKDLNDLNSNVKGVEGSSEKAINQFKVLSGTFTDTASKTKILGTDLGTVTSSLGSAEAMSALVGGAMGGIMAAGIQIAIDAMKQLVVAIGQFIAESIQIGVSFEAQMSRVGAITGATGEEFKLLTQAAREFGADTVFSTQEVGKAMEYMGMAGWDAEQSISGMQGVLDLAAASGEELALVSDTVTDVLTALGEEADQAGRMADVFAAAATSSNTNVAKMAYTMKYAAPIAGALSYSMEDVAIATGLMANAGIKGETAGTNLRAMFTELRGEVSITSDTLGDFTFSTENSDGSMRELYPILMDLRSGFSGLSESEKAANAESLVGKEAMSGLLAIVNASDESFNKLTDSINNSEGAAAGMATTMNDNVAGTFKEIESKIESIKISLYTAFEPLIDGASEYFNSLLGIWDTLFNGMGEGLNNFFTMFDPIWSFFTGIVDMVGAVIKSIYELGSAFTTVFAGEVLESSTKTADAIEALVDLFVLGMEAITAVLVPAAEILGNFVAATINLLKLDFDGFIINIENMGNTLIGTTDKANQEIEKNFEDHTTIMENTQKKHQDTMVELSKTSTDAMGKELSAYEKKLKEQYDEESRSGREAIRKRLEHKNEELDKEYRMEEEHYRKVEELKKRTSVYSSQSIYSDSSSSYQRSVSQKSVDSRTVNNGGSTSITGNNFTIKANNYQEFVDSMERAVVSGEW